MPARGGKDSPWSVGWPTPAAPPRGRIRKYPTGRRVAGGAVAVVAAAGRSSSNISPRAPWLTPECAMPGKRLRRPRRGRPAGPSGRRYRGRGDVFARRAGSRATSRCRAIRGAAGLEIFDGRLTRPGNPREVLRYRATSARGPDVDLLHRHQAVHSLHYMRRTAAAAQAAPPRLALKAPRTSPSSPSLAPFLDASCRIAGLGARRLRRRPRQRAALRRHRLARPVARERGRACSRRSPSGTASR